MAAEPRPTWEPPIAENIPAALIERRQWVVWRFELRKAKDGYKWTKVPVNARDGREAKSTDPATWNSFAEALANYPKHRCDGLGFVFSPDDPFAGIDLDDCIDADGNMHPDAAALVARFNTYAEVSPSGTGVKLILIGAKPEGAGCRKKRVEGCDEIEVYDQGRYFTITGNRWPGTPAEIADGQEPLTDLCNKLWPPQASGPRPAPAGTGFDGDDDDLIRRASTAKNGEAFAALWRGETAVHGSDASAADLALCAHLAFWTGRDPDRIDHLFRRSGLFREKWDERRGARTYGQITIGRAVEGCRDVYTPRRRPAPRDCRGDPYLAGKPGGSVLAGDEDGDQGGVSGPGGPESGGAAAEPRSVPLGGRDPESGRLVLSCTRTLPTAEAYVREFHTHRDGRTLCSFAGSLVEWRDNRYVQLEDESVKQRLQPWLHGALRYVVNRKSQVLELVDFPANPTTVEQSLKSIRSFAHLAGETPAPSWLGGGEDRPPAREILPCRTMNLHVPSGTILAPTPLLFTPCALEFDYGADPDPPEAWINFLVQVFGEDLESVQLLQEFMGYCLIADTSLQKMLLVVGPKRSGKGTIARVIKALVGAGNVVGPTTSSLAGTFGLQPLIGKSLAILSDARFSGPDVQTVIERLLSISGEDALTIHQKYLPAVTMTLPTRFILLTNEIPRLPDASAALAGRFMVLRMFQSFYGKEDPHLTARLLKELPGILKWALDGRRDLTARGHFIQPETGRESFEEMEELSSPVTAFIRECCQTGPTCQEDITIVYQAWKDWCSLNGRDHPGTPQSLGRDLKAAVPHLRCRRRTNGTRYYEGIAVKAVFP